MSTSRLHQRLLMSISKASDGGCWEWTGQISNSGHGRLKVKDEHGDLCMRSAQHTSYEAFIGPVEKGLLVCKPAETGFALTLNTLRRLIQRADGIAISRRVRANLD